MLSWAVWLLLSGLAEGALLPLPADLLLAPAAILRPFVWWIFVVQALCGALGGLALAHFCGQWHAESFTRLLSRLPGTPALFVARCRDRARAGFGRVVLGVATFTLPARIVAFESGAAGVSLPSALLRAGTGLALRYTFVAFVASRLRVHAMADLFRVSRNAGLTAAILTAAVLAAIVAVEIRHRRRTEDA